MQEVGVRYGNEATAFKIAAGITRQVQRSEDTAVSKIEWLCINCIRGHHKHSLHYDRKYELTNL